MGQTRSSGGGVRGSTAGGRVGRWTGQGGDGGRRGRRGGEGGGLAMSPACAGVREGGGQHAKARDGPLNRRSGRCSGGGGVAQRSNRGCGALTPWEVWPRGAPGVAACGPKPSDACW